MPIYEYECSNCGKRFEKMQSITAEPLVDCINCGGGPIRRVLHPVGIIFKGSGWYITDSRKPSGGDSSSAAKEAGETATKKSEGGGAKSSPSNETPGSKPSSD